MKRDVKRAQAAIIIFLIAAWAQFFVFHLVVFIRFSHIIKSVVQFIWNDRAFLIEALPSAIQSCLKNQETEWI